jgi:hypothetical protein
MSSRRGLAVPVQAGTARLSALLAYHLAGRQTDDILLGELGWPDVPALRGVVTQVIRDGVDLGVRTREQVGLGALSQKESAEDAR